jgi:three-Cys-motif partner protein
MVPGPCIVRSPIVNRTSRLLKRDGNIDECLQEKLDFVFGERAWIDAFYETKKPRMIKTQRSFLDEEDDAPDEGLVKTADYSTIESYFKARLRTIFAKVAEKSVWLKNSKNTPLYVLFFMAGNERGAHIAVDIAESIMSKP